MQGAMPTSHYRKITFIMEECGHLSYIGDNMETVKKRQWGLQKLRVRNG
ncbi:MAG: hypothetical protein IKK91_09830 [Ruminococcus sp.]|nr:hypothetical protein [Ruminococcus sp.]